MTKIIAPSILAADFSDLRSACEMINESDAEWLHVDVMDGVFVPNISFGFPIMEAVKKYCKKPLDVHLMIVEPEKYVERFIKAGAEILTVHLETLANPITTLRQIKEFGAKAGLTINPDVPVSSLKGLVSEADMVLLMSVFAGYGGQKFIEETWQRIEELKEIISEENPDCLIEVDGGVNTENAKKLFNAGVNILVAGNAVFKSENPKETIRKMLL
ncbi:Ribulose-phosphate 3-epimerase [uncultured Paludibacter sp.]|uniref:Ribulose-phosphate 3-epimerase n=1 Tax=uncultured Paludibacter sp. TaxID=497635 RepID=A0A653AFR4_9BACT|nr:Ribulose-phosphate 3-epimerase [uncultured Paludibacter sp.]